ncbi:uncharacterized protein B0I36DRAFT_334857 [Microdochium trichocladiopsis]|uniref:Uncharacterized protein n=1 Tax=Microdochium trichocladiopsis TaxID=1682393 RepID=A0A9P8XZX1_9PEZI|nr:uncharacterized protein B0I36DRAFT_334857 [Microdochium trichocladiopsis]KAH7021609.1 hypothetical protein B0I36DRAFT_334857 [Microdochium trichocladiopsis]
MERQIEHNTRQFSPKETKQVNQDNLSITSTGIVFKGPAFTTPWWCALSWDACLLVYLSLDPLLVFSLLLGPLVLPFSPSVGTLLFLFSPPLDTLLFFSLPSLSPLLLLSSSLRPLLILLATSLDPLFLLFLPSLCPSCAFCNRQSTAVANVFAALLSLPLPPLVF